MTLQDYQLHTHNPWSGFTSVTSQPIKFSALKNKKNQFSHVLIIKNPYSQIKTNKN